MKKPTVSIVIPAYNESGQILHCLSACVQQNDMPDEIIVVDNNSKDDTAVLVRQFIADHPDANIRLISEMKQGLVPARNTGLAAATSEVLGRIDADAILEPGWVAAVREFFADGSIDAASGPVLYHDMPLPKVGFAFDKRIRQTLYRSAKDHKFLFGTNMAVRASAWHEIVDRIIPDPNDEHHEDISIALTLFKNGYEIGYCPDMVAGMSARRIEDNPKDFYKYVMRFERTFKAYNLKSARARMPIFIYLLIYFPIRTIRKFYNTETRQFTLAKVRADVDAAREKITRSL